MGRLEVQGIVALKDGLPYVQFRHLDDDNELELQFQSTPGEARELAQTIIEASMNAVYDASLLMWARELDPSDDTVGPQMVDAIRRFRADKWGLPDNPEDWTP